MEVGKLAGVCELAVQTRPDVLVWAFTHASQCKIWRLCNFIDPVACSRSFVCRNGIVHNSFEVDGTGDVIMRDAPPAPQPSSLYHDGNGVDLPLAERSAILGFDGNASGVLKKMPKALAVENDEWVDLLDVRGCSDVWYDGDGDVIMWYGT
jgi:hypothetical protein